MARVVVHDPYWQTMGGGERYVAAFAKLALDLKHTVYIDFPENMAEKVKTRFGIDISGAEWGNDPGRSDMLFWVSDGSLPTNIGGKTIVHLQFPFQNIGGKNLLNLAKSRFYKFVVNSNFTKKYIDREFAVKSVVVYPPIATTDFKPGKKEKTIVYVSRFSNLTQQKGHEVLIKAFTKIAKDLKGWQLILAGSTNVGTESGFLDGLKKLADGFPVTIMENPTFSDIQSLYAKATIFCSPSGFGVDEDRDPVRVEHFGISVVEAMAAGCVPVITRLGGHKEIVEDGKSGYFWDSSEQLQQLLITLTKPDANLDVVSQAAKERSKLFSEENFRASFQKLL